MKLFLFIFFILLLQGCNSSTSSTKQASIDENKPHEHNSTNDTNQSSTPISQAIKEPDDQVRFMLGKGLYYQNCVTCHFDNAEGIGHADIKKASPFEIESAIEGDAPEMSFLKGKLTKEEISHISYFLQFIGYDITNESNISQKTSLGEMLFFDTNLSLNRTMSCATCHMPNHAFIDARYDTNPLNGALSVGDDNLALGGRNTPMIAYALFSPNFYTIDEFTHVGGQFWDGRAENLKAQAKGPFLDQAEMMMPNIQSVIDRIQESSSYVKNFKKLYGDDIFDDSKRAYDALANSIALFEKSDTFSPFDSKYDRTKLPKEDNSFYTFTEQEKLGYQLFFDQNRTHCSKCHTLNSNSEASLELFTNYRYENIAIPKNDVALLLRDGGTDTTDLGLGGRPDINNSIHYGKFKVPTLRNIAVTKPYMSNGVFNELETVIKYFLYLSGNGHTMNPETDTKWGEAEIGSNMNHQTLNEMGSLTQEEIDALVEFLKTLTDKRYEHLLE